VLSDRISCGVPGAVNVAVPVFAILRSDVAVDPDVDAIVNNTLFV
jgi:hypothetical protein